MTGADRRDPGTGFVFQRDTDIFNAPDPTERIETT